MTPMNSSALRCLSFDCGSLIVPGFSLPRHSFYGISVPVQFGNNWLRLARTLSGEFENPNVELAESGIAILPQLGAGHIDDNMNVSAILKRLGANDAAIQARGRVKSTTTIDELPGTPRLLIEILDALDKDVQILVFSTCGLDPVGISSVRDIVGSSEISALNLFSRSLSSFYSSFEMFDEIVECSSIM